MENNYRSFEEISIGIGAIGAIGGGGGKNFVYKPESLIKQIIIRHAGVIDSLVFICQDGKHSPNFGGNGGEKTSKVNIDCASEYLTGITGTIGSYLGYRVITSLIFHTNVTLYGPFGNKYGDSFTLPVEDGFIVGFHGRFGSYLDAIGYYVRPLVGTNHLLSSNLSNDIMEVLVPTNPIPFGGSNQSYGKEFDDGVFNGIIQIIVHVDSLVNTLQGIRTQYVSAKDEGGLVWSQRHGAHSSSLQKIQIFPDEFLIGISGYYGAVQSDVSCDVIKSITFLTNKDVYGPFGSEIGTFFSSPAEGGKIAGFYGRAGNYLYSIGVHTKYM